MFPNPTERLQMELKNDISQIYGLLTQEAQHSFLVEDDKVRQSSLVVLIRATCFHGTDLN